VLDIDYKDLSAFNRNGKQEFITAYNKQLVLTISVFNLGTRPLFKASLFKISENEHLLTFVAHYIVCDGWSIRL